MVRLRRESPQPDAFVTPASSSSISPRDWALLVLLSSLWSVGYFLNQVALRELPVATVVLGRVGFAAIALLIVIIALGIKLPLKFQMWFGFLILGLFNNVLPFGLIVGAQQWIDSGLAAILVGTSPLMSALLSRLLGYESLSMTKITGLAVGISGLVVLVGPSVLQGLSRGTIGQLLVILGALSFAVAAIYGRRFKAYSPLVMSAGQLVCSSLVVLPIALIVDQPWRYSPTLDAWAALLAIGFVCTAFGYIIYFRLLASAGATNMLLVTLLSPIGAVFLGTVFLAESFTWQRLGGMALIAIGLALIDGRIFNTAVRRRGNFRPPAG